MRKTLIPSNDPILKTVCKLVTEFDDNLWQLINDMRDTMQFYRGCGLAAPQIGKAVAVIIVQKQKTKGVYAVVNPEIVEQSEYTTIGPEGCLSYPGVSKLVERPNSITVKGKNSQGGDISIHATGFEARIFFHEIDHVNGCCLLGK